MAESNSDEPAGEGIPGLNGPFLEDMPSIDPDQPRADNGTHESPETITMKDTAPQEDSQNRIVSSMSPRPLHCSGVTNEPGNTPANHAESNAHHNSSQAESEDDVFSRYHLSPFLQKQVDELKAWKDRPYNPEKDEPAPNWQSFNPHFKQIDIDCSKIVKGMNDLLNRVSASNPCLKVFKNSLENRSKFRPPEPILVGLLGNSGVGKSSLINSLLSVPGLALTDSGTRACTNNIIEYCYSFPNQQSPYSVKIYFFDAAKRRKVLNEHLQNYVMHQRVGQDMEEEGRSESFMTSETSFEVLSTLFNDRPEFANPTRGRAFLDKELDGPGREILGAMCQWLDELLRSYDVVEDALDLNADTPEDLAKVVEPFIKTPFIADNEPAQASPWPIVRLVKIGLDCPLLREGIVIADVPGVSDTNVTRVSYAYLHLRRCNFLLVCADISRIETDRSTQSHLSRAFKTNGSMKALVATRADVIGDSNELQSRAAQNELVRELRMVLERMNEDVKSLNDQKKKLKSKTPGEVLLQLSELSEAKKMLEKIERGQYMRIRNQQAKRSLRATYKIATGDASELEVWFVSNSEYMLQLEAYDEDLPIPVEYSGVPALRLRLKHLTEAAKVEKRRFYVQHVLPDVLTSIEIWSNPVGAKRHDGLVNIVSQGLEGCEEIAERHLRALIEAFNESLLNVVGENVQRWKDESRAISRAWTDKRVWKVQTFVAFLRKHGKHKTSKKPFQNWNNDLHAPVLATLTPAWATFEGAVANIFGYCTDLLKELLNKVKEELNQSHGAALIPLHLFYQKIDYQKAVFENIVSTERANFGDAMRSVIPFPARLLSFLFILYICYVSGESQTDL